MGEQDVPIREITDARARMSELADELARRLEKEHLKEVASTKVMELKEQAKERATEKIDELKSHAKETVMHKTMDIKERADTPKGWSMLGAIIGAGVGSMLMKKVFDVRHDRQLHSGYDRDMSLVPAPEGGLMRPTGDVRGSLGTDIGVRTSTDVGTMNVGATGMGVGTQEDSGLKARASSAVDMAKDKASDLKERASGLVDMAKDKASGLREHIPSRHDMTQRTSGWYDTVSDNPVLVAIGGLAIGALCASLIPVTSRERRLIEPAKAKVRESISNLGDQLETKLSGQSEDVSGVDDEFQASAASESENERGTIPPLPKLDDYTSVH